MPSKRCPNCDLWNFESSVVCECGYDFVSGDAPSRLRQKTVEDYYPILFIVWLGFHALAGWIIFFPPKTWVNSLQAGWEVILLYTVGGVVLFNIFFVVILVGMDSKRKR